MISNFMILIIPQWTTPSISMIQMGYSYGQDDVPLMCFNGPKTFQLGWFPSHYETLVFPNFSWSGGLYHSLDQSSIPPTGKMVIKIPGFVTSSGTSTEYLDYYVSFNRANGNNIGTQEASNKVVIHTSQNDAFTYAPKSKLVSVLSAGGDFQFTVRDIPVTVTVSPTIDLSVRTPHATITIVSGTPSPTSFSFAPSMSIAPSSSPSVLVPVPSSSPSSSQSPSSSFYGIKTPYIGGTYWAASKGGIMFDITATQDIAIIRLDIKLFYVNFPGFNSATDIEIYTKVGSYKGYQASMSSWTKHMDRTTINPPNVDDVDSLFLTPLKSDIFNPIVVPGGATVAIFITNRDANNYIEMSHLSSAAEHTSGDGEIKVETGTFQKYEEFSGSENDARW